MNHSLYACAAIAIGITGCSGNAATSTLTSGNDAGDAPDGGATGDGASPALDGSVGEDASSAPVGHDGGAADGGATDAGSKGTDGGASGPSAVCPGPLGTRTPVNTMAAGSLQNPSFSPDSTRLLFTNFVGGYDVGNSSVDVVAVAGGSPTVLMPATAQNVDLPGCWNAALDQIVVSSDAQGSLDQIARVDPSGATPPQYITTPSMRAWEPSLSPDGQWVVFEAHSPQAGSNDPGRIWKVRVDGTQLTQLTPDTVDAKEPNWSPKGDKILYQSPGASGANDIFTIDPSGGSLVNVTNGGGSDNTDGSWSPDGAFIVYSTDLSGDSLASLYVIPVAGGTPERVTFGSGYDGAPSWSPDGRCIAFETSEGDPDGSPGTTIAVVPAP